MTSSAPAEPQNRPSNRGGWITLLLLANLGVAIWAVVSILDTQRTLDARLVKLEQRVRQNGYESTSDFEGHGFLALLDHLQYWAPWLQKTTMGSSERFNVETRVQDIVESMALLPDAFPQIATVLKENPAGGDADSADETRKWLLVAAQRAAPEKAVEILAAVVEGKDMDVSLRLRRFATDQLLKSAPERVGKILHELLSRDPSRRRSNQTEAAAIRSKQMFHFIDAYVASKHPDAEKTLVRILMKTEYFDPMTVQRCVEALGQAKTRSAASRIQKLYWQQAPVPGQVPNPIFRRKCMEAVVQILGQEAVPFLREIDKRESDASIQARLRELKNELDFTAK